MRGRLLRLHKSLEDSLRRESARILGKPDAAILRYEAESKRDLRALLARARPIQKQTMLSALSRADCVLVADYHTLDQAQRSALRIFRELAEKKNSSRPERWTLALELIPSRHQKDLDAFMAGEIAAEEFRRRIRYAETWGFAWENYAPLFDCARKLGARVIALNAGTQAGLRARDEWAALRLREEKKRQERAGIERPRFLIVYGELHVTRSHLAARIREVWGKTSPEIALVHQNLDALFWKIADRTGHLPSGIHALGKLEFCLFSAPPWAKLRSLLDWAELHPIVYEGPAGEFVEEDEPLTEADLDPLAQVRAFHGELCRFLGLAHRPREDWALLPEQMREADWDRLARSRPRLSASELQLVRALHAEGRRFLLPAQARLSLGDGDRNSTAEIAALAALFDHQSEEPFFRATPTDFQRRALMQAFAYLGSLFINPRRKADLPEDHRRWLGSRRGRKLSPAERIEAAARRHALRVVERARAGKPWPKPPASARANWRASQRAGQLFGILLFQRWLEGHLPDRAWRTIFLKRWSLSPRALHDAVTALGLAIGPLPRRSLRADEL